MTLGPVLRLFVCEKHSIFVLKQTGVSSIYLGAGQPAHQSSVPITETGVHRHDTKAHTSHGLPAAGYEHTLGALGVLCGSIPGFGQRLLPEVRFEVAAEAFGEVPLGHAADAGDEAEEPDEFVQ